MSEKKRIKGRALAWILTLVYFASYVTRINFAATLVAIQSDTGHANIVLSFVLVGMSITYGLGQIINGRLGDIVNPKKLILCGLIAATVVNLIFPLFSSSVPMMVILWTINGFAQAMMWPPMVKILVANCDDKMYGYSVVRITWGSAFGTILVYLVAPLLISLIGWKAVFIFSAAIGVVATLSWAAMMSRVSLEDNNSDDVTLIKEKKGFKLPSIAVFPLIFAALGIIFQGMLRDGISNWMPSYIKGVFKLGDEASILITVILSIFTVVSISFARWFYEKFFTNEVFCAAVIFGAAAFFSLVMFFLFDGYVAILMMALISACMHSVNLMLISYLPKRFKKYGNISTISGIVNSCTYVGAAISTYGIAFLSGLIGWQYTVSVWCGVALLGVLVCLIASRRWKKFI